MAPRRPAAAARGRRARRAGTRGSASGCGPGPGAGQRSEPAPRPGWEVVVRARRPAGLRFLPCSAWRSGAGEARYRSRGITCRWHDPALADRHAITARYRIAGGRSPGRPRSARRIRPPSIRATPARRPGDPDRLGRQGRLAAANPGRLAAPAGPAGTLDLGAGKPGTAGPRRPRTRDGRADRPARPGLGHWRGGRAAGQPPPTGRCRSRPGSGQNTGPDHRAAGPAGIRTPPMPDVPARPDHPAGSAAPQAADDPPWPAQDRAARVGVEAYPADPATSPAMDELYDALLDRLRLDLLRAYGTAES